MRRFSQRNSLVTLADINITPLLDLAFVLLIIFVITTPLLEQGMTLKLPSGGAQDTHLVKNDIRTLEIGRNGEYLLEKVRMPLDRVEQELVRDYRANPKLVVHIRADKAAAYGLVTDAIERCTRNGINTFSLRTEPPAPK